MPSFAHQPETILIEGLRALGGMGTIKVTDTPWGELGFVQTKERLLIVQTGSLSILSEFAPVLTKVIRQHLEQTASFVTPTLHLADRGRLTMNPRTFEWSAHTDTKAVRAFLAALRTKPSAVATAQNAPDRG